MSRSEAEVLAPALFQARDLSQMTGREWEQDALRFGQLDQRGGRARGRLIQLLRRVTLLGEADPVELIQIDHRATFGRAVCGAGDADLNDQNVPASNREAQRVAGEVESGAQKRHACRD
jgi:hypothetical protein